MAISIKKYVSSDSGVSGGSGVRARDLMTRIFTTNLLVPSNTIIEIDSADDALTYFGANSEEYKRAVFYFGWVSKQTRRAKKLSFARYVDEDSNPIIYGNKATYKVSTFQAITSGVLTVTFGESKTFSGLDFSTAASLADVASIVQTALNAETGEVWAGATVTFNAIDQRFIITGGKADNLIVNASGSVAALMGLSSGAINSDGALKQEPLTAVSESAELSSNFASFLFMPDLTLEQIIAIAAWNKAENVMYMYLVSVTKENAEEYSAALIGTGGTSLELAGVNGEYTEMMPGIILAATDYSKINSAQNYMFNQFPSVTPNVTKTDISNTYDALRVNYYGQTQTAGQNISFYQRGLMMGGSTDLVDQNIYANEIWLKDSISSQIMELFLNLSRVPANSNGRAQLLAAIQSIIDNALYNGVISVGKDLNKTQKLYIAELTGDDTAYSQVQDKGYWLDCWVVTETTPDGRTECKAEYILIYSKDDVIRKATGTNTLI